MDPEAEDILIHRVLIGAAVGAVATAFGAALVIAGLIASNFNVMNWFE